MKNNTYNHPLDDQILDELISKFDTDDQTKNIKELSTIERIAIFNYLKELKMYRQIGLLKDLMEQHSKPSYMLKLTLGDWSDDGHGKYKNYTIKSNYPATTIRQAYKDSCKMTGLTFNHNEDYTGLGKDACKIWCEYEDSTMPDKAVKILESYDINCDDVDDVLSAASIIMQFIRLSMPRDFDYKIILENFEPINGYWIPELNVQFGYGLFD